MRARVLKIDGRQVTLGVYYQGEWLRVRAQTRIPLREMAWIEGELVIPDDDAEVYFRIDEARITHRETDPTEGGGIDLEA